MAIAPASWSASPGMGASGFLDQLPLPSVDQAIQRVIVFMPGWEGGDQKNCFGRPPASIMRFAEEGKARIYFLCFDIDRSNRLSTYPTSKSIGELRTLLDELIARGIKPSNIFLAGQSYGGWLSLTAFYWFPEKFNSSIAFAPAFSGKRSSDTPSWKKSSSAQSQVDRVIKASKMKALVFAYTDDEYNRPKDLTFLTDAFDETQLKLVSYSCSAGHSTAYKDCDLKNTIRDIGKLLMSDFESIDTFRWARESVRDQWAVGQCLASGYSEEAETDSARIEFIDCVKRYREFY